MTFRTHSCDRACTYVESSRTRDAYEGGGSARSRSSCWRQLTEAEGMNLLLLVVSAFYLAFYVVRGRSAALAVGLVALIFSVSGVE